MINRHRDCRCLTELFEIEFERDEKEEEEKISPHPGCEIDLDGKAWRNEVVAWDYCRAYGMSQVSVVLCVNLDIL